MSIIYDPRDHGMGRKFHGYGGGGFPQLVLPDAAVSSSFANGPGISLGNTTVFPASAFSTSFANNPVLALGGVTLTPASAVSTSVAKTPAILIGGNAAFVQSKKAYPDAALTYNSSTTAGSLLIAAVSWTGGNGSVLPTAEPTITDSQLNTWTALTKYISTSPFNGGVSVAIKLFYLANCPGGADTVTLGSKGATDTDFCIDIYEFSGIALSSPVETTVTTSSPNTLATTAVSGNVTTTVPCMLFTMYANEAANQGTISAGTGYTIGQNTPTHANAENYKLNVAAGTYTPTFNSVTSNKGWILYSVAFKTL